MPTHQPHVAGGTILAAAPDLLDPNFMHTVLVMCEHTSSGAYGLVINKRSSLTIDRLLPEDPVLGKLALPVAWGGPVQNDTLQILHRYPDRIPGGFKLAEGVYLGGELSDVTAVLAATDDPNVHHGIRFILGCSGWGEGQLDGEIDGGTWVPLAMDATWVFGMDRGGRDDQSDTWRHALRSLGRQGQDLAVMPPDIGWN